MAFRPFYSLGFSFNKTRNKKGALIGIDILDHLVQGCADDSVSLEPSHNCHGLGPVGEDWEPW